MNELGLQVDEWLDVPGKESIVFDDIYPKKQMALKALNLWSKQIKNILPDELMLEDESPFATNAFSFMIKEEQEIFNNIKYQTKMSPFTQENILENEENKIKDIIYQFTLSPLISCKEKLTNRLLILLNDAREEGETISVNSLREFYKFFHNYTNAKCPMISLTPENNIYASWKNEQKDVLSIHFLQDGNVRYIKSTRNENYPKKVAWLTGIIKSEMLKNKEIKYKILEWIFE